jgi:hypothetical protein
MPTFTSVKSGYWNDPTVWDQNAVPADGDSVIVAAGHTVTFNVDQSSFTNGLAGLTINGTLKIPSKDEDSNMPDFVCLKVNANIAGSGSFLIGSSTYPITYPQSAKIMVNGTITVATFNAYGEQRSPLWDYLAQDAAAGATQIVLQNGLPLRSGDIIAIGRSDIVGGWSESSSARGLHTVASYNPDTKTVTLNEALTHARSGTGVRACLVILLSRQIVISKYGTNNVTLLSGSGRTIQGVLFQPESGATAPSITNATSSSFSYTSNLAVGYNFFVGSSLTFNYHTGHGGTALLTDITSATVSNIAIINSILNWGGGGTFNHTNVHIQNASGYYNPGSASAVFTYQNITIKNANFIDRGSVGLNIYNVNNMTIVDGNLVVAIVGIAYIFVTNLQWYGFLSNNYQVGGDSRGIVVVKNAIGNHAVSGRQLILAGGNSRNCVFVNFSLSGYGSTLGSSPEGSCKFINCSLENAFNPILLNHLSGVSEIINLSTNAYYRPTLRIPSVAEQLWANRIIVKGLTVAGTQHPKAFEHLFPHGYAKNRWDAATPDYTTFDFRLTQSSFAGQPIWLEYQVFTADPIRVTGTITQLGTGESVKVQIFSAGKEPLYGDTPDFEQTYTTTGDINVNWTPTDKRTWIVRVLAYLQQTTNPVTIANLQVAGGGTGDGGGSPVVGEPAFVFAG